MGKTIGSEILSSVFFVGTKLVVSVRFNMWGVTFSGQLCFFLLKLLCDLSFGLDLTEARESFVLKKSLIFSLVTVGVRIPFPAVLQYVLSLLSDHSVSVRFILDAF